MDPQSLSTYVTLNDRFLEHNPGYGHPESPSRYTNVVKSLKPLHLPVIEAKEAATDELELCHPAEYIRLVEEECRNAKRMKKKSKREECTMSTGDTEISPESFEVAKLASGAVLEGIDAVINGTAKNVFCPARPPGHHACSEKAMGFCLFNNIAIGAEYLKTKGYDRILIVDWDAHHGNGTQNIFYNDPSVFYFSTHQANHYPGTGGEYEVGRGKGIGYTKNYPIKPNKDARKKIISVFQEKLPELMETFKPQFVLISAGFDAHIKDPLSKLNLETRDFADLTKIVMDIAHTYAEDRIVSVMEGGYNLQALSASVKVHVATLNTYIPQYIATTNNHRRRRELDLSNETLSLSSQVKRRAPNYAAHMTNRKKSRVE